MSTPAHTPSAAPAPHPARKKALAAVAGVVAVAGLAYGAYWTLVLNHYESTDNAYVQGNVVQVTSVHLVGCNTLVLVGGL